MDDRLAKGLSRRLHDESFKQVHTFLDIYLKKHLLNKFPTNYRSCQRFVSRMVKKFPHLIHHVAVEKVPGGYLLSLQHLDHASLGVKKADEPLYKLLRSSTETLRYKKGRQPQFDFKDSMSITHHAVARWIERDRTLPKYNTNEYLVCLKLPAIQSRMTLDVLEQIHKEKQLIHPIGIATRGGLFLGYTEYFNATTESGGVYRELQRTMMLHTFYGQHEMDVELQAFHQDLLMAQTHEDILDALSKVGVEKLAPYTTLPKSVRDVTGMTHAPQPQRTVH